MSRLKREVVDYPSGEKASNAIQPHVNKLPLPPKPVTLGRYSSDKASIFDPSLIIPPSHILLEQILRDNELDLLLTKRMLEILFPKRRDNEYLSVLLEGWGANPEQIPAVLAWVHKNENTYKKSLKIIPLSKELEDFKSLYIIPSIRRYKDYPEPILQFISDEICSALQFETPIFCTETSSWTIVNILKGIGAKVRSEIIEHARDKSLIFTKRKTWKKILAITAGSAFAWVMGGPIGGLGALGTSAIYVAIEDP